MSLFCRVGNHGIGCRSGGISGRNAWSAAPALLVKINCRRNNNDDQY